MAKCPKCGGDMDAMATKCPTCGYDFPTEMVKRDSGLSWAYSTFSDVALIVGMIATGVACVLVVINAVVSLFRKRLWDAFISYPLAFLILFAMLVVFARVLDVDRKDE